MVWRREFSLGRVCRVALCALTTVTASAAEPGPWRLPDWKFRAAIRIVARSDDPDVDAAAVKVLCMGRGREDGADYRVLDAAGASVAYQLVYHDAPRYSWLLFRAPAGSREAWIYFGNPDAVRPGEQVRAEDRPGAGPPAGDWIPRCGLVLATRARPPGPNPTSADEMAALMAGSGERYGARFQRRISDALNPFGPSDYYISVYRGWIRIPQNGRYWFCTASNEASFSFVDGRKLVHWPGRHTEARGRHGEKNAAVELDAGLHYIEYYHEEVMLQQVAFLGWRPLRGQGGFAAIPEEVFVAPYTASVLRYESAGKIEPAFEPRLVDSIWPPERESGQYTRYRFAPKADAAADDVRWEWRFGDGQRAAGREAEHVFLSPGVRSVTLSRTDASGTAAAQWPLRVYEIQHGGRNAAADRYRVYATLVREYDTAALDAESLAEMVHLLAESGNASDTLAAGERFLARFAESEEHRALAAEVHFLVAEAACEAGAESGASVRYGRSYLDRSDAPEDRKLRILGRLIRLDGVEGRDPDRAREWIARVEELGETARPTADVTAALREAWRQAGEMFLRSDEPGRALAFLARAEEYSRPVLPPEVKAARIGSYDLAVRRAAARGDPDGVLRVVEEWERILPTERARGRTAYWRGRALVAKRAFAEAEPYLRKCIARARGAWFETEARWLLARALTELGRPEQARSERQALIATGIRDSFTEKAAAELAGGE